MFNSYFSLLSKENKKAFSSCLNSLLLDQDTLVYPPILFPLFILIKIIVGPLLSHKLWKAFGKLPSTDALNINLKLKLYKYA